jgi:hypothetical protein
MVTISIGCDGGGWSWRWFITSSMLDFSLALHKHDFVGHLYGSSHVGTVLSWDL